MSAVVPVRVLTGTGNSRTARAVWAFQVVAGILLPLIADRAEVGVMSIAIQEIT